MFSDALLHAYLDEVAPAEQMVAIEVALRTDGALQKRLAALVAGRDAGLHSLGEVWRRRRLTCPTREQLGSHLLGVLPEGLADYVRFHLEQAECRWCAANLEDLQKQHDATSRAEERDDRRQRYFQSSVGRLS